jgi:hypothetical protein
VLVYLLALVLVYGVGLPWWIWRGAQDRRDPPTPGAVGAVRLCLGFGLPGMALWLYLSGGGSSLPHWPATSVLSLLPLAAIGLSHGVARYKKTFFGLLLLQGLGVLGVSALMLLGGLSAETGAQSQSQPGDALSAQAPTNPFADLHGWHQAAEHAVALAQREQANGLAVMNWSLASRVAWYARPYPVKVVNSHHDQFDRWFGPITVQDRLIVLDWSLMSFSPPTDAGRFASCVPLDSLPTLVGTRQIAHFHFSLCQGWQGPSPSEAP